MTRKNQWMGNFILVFPSQLQYMHNIHNAGNGGGKTNVDVKWN